MATAIEAPAAAEGLIQHVPTTQAELFSLLDSDQIAMLSAGLDPDRVRVHPETGMAHLEQWDVRRTLNQVFGFCGWSDQLKSIDVAYEETRRPGPNQPANAWWVVYRAVVRLEIRNRRGNVVSVHDGVATGESSSLVSPGAAHDLASKTAHSQALKRAAANWGDQFGLSLYNAGSVLPVVVPDAQGHVAGIELAWDSAPELLRRLQVAKGAGVAGATVTTRDGEVVVLGRWVKARGKALQEEAAAAAQAKLAEQRAAAEEAQRGRQAAAAAPAAPAQQPGAPVDWSTALPARTPWPKDDARPGDGNTDSVERHAAEAGEHTAAEPPPEDPAEDGSQDDDLANLSTVVSDGWDDLDKLVRARSTAEQQGLLHKMVPSESGRHHKIKDILDTRIGELRTAAAASAPRQDDWVEPAGPLFSYAGSILDSDAAEPPPAKRQVDELARRAERGWDELAAVEAVLKTATGMGLDQERIHDRAWKEHVLGVFLSARIAELRQNVGVAA
jgi:hypothetical protein